MFGIFVMLSKVEVVVDGYGMNFAYLAALLLFAFYLTLDVVFSLAFLLMALPIAWLAIGNAMSRNARLNTTSRVR